MKNIFRCALLGLTVALFAACSNGDYVANPSSNSNGSINPLDPLKEGDFTWSGTDPMSADINGTNMVFGAYWRLDSGRNTLTGTNGTKMIVLSLKDVYTNNLYDMGYQQYQTNGFVTDSFGNVDSYYFSVLGNSGGVWISQNDSAVIKGKFYFQGVNSRGQVMNITHGHFNVSKI